MKTPMTLQRAFDLLLPTCFYIAGTFFRSGVALIAGALLAFYYGSRLYDLHEAEGRRP